MRPLLLKPLLLPVLLAVVPSLGRGQVLEIRSATPAPSAPTVGTLRLRQQEFEGFRRERLPSWNPGRGGRGDCDERVGRFCYWYDDDEQAPPAEPREVRDARQQFIAALDSAAREYSGDRWISGQLMRYLVEAERYEEAIATAGRCTADGWWCPALRGFANHLAGHHAASDSAWSRALAVMDARERCEWRDLKLLLDDELLREYRNTDCAQREAQEERIWWLSRPMLSSPGSDARAEFLSRRLYTRFLDDAPSLHSEGFDSDERELLLRYGWPRAWTVSRASVPGRGSQRVITGHEPVPAPPMMPMAATVRNPAFSDSLGWRGKGLPGVRARYSPAYARRLLPLPHQSALFRRGDSALVVMAYDVSDDAALARAATATDKLSAALVLTRGEAGDAAITRLATPGVRGTITATTRWEPLLMSAEVAASSASTLARARYGMRGTDTPGSRVAISDLLLFEPYDGMPRRLDDVLPHARASLTLGTNSKVGVYWETYNTNPLGEGINVAITVAPEQRDGGGWLRRGLTALRLVREAQPVSVGITDMSARGLGYTPRAVVVDLSTLKPGRYIMELEITAQGTAPVRAERVITVDDRR